MRGYAAEASTRVRSKINKRREISEQRQGQEHEVNGNAAVHDVMNETRRWTGYPAAKAQREDNHGKREGGHHSAVVQVAEDDDDDVEQKNAMVLGYVTSDT